MHTPRHGLARVLSKRGVCSRTQAATWIREGRVRVDGRTVLDPEFPIHSFDQVIEVAGGAAVDAFVYLALNKPRGLLTTTRDERGRDTVYRCFDGTPLPWIAPVGRLDKASEGLLLFSNDPEWAARITDPVTGPCKTYHVQIDRLPSPDLLEALRRGVLDEGERLAARAVDVLREGGRNAWLQVVLDEGRNRHIRRLMAAHEVGVLRLVRTAIGAVELGTLAKGGWRMLAAGEAEGLAPRSIPRATG